MSESTLFDSYIACPIYRFNRMIDKMNPMIGFVSRILSRSIQEMGLWVPMLIFLVLRIIDVSINLYNFITPMKIFIGITCLIAGYIFVIVNIKTRPYLIGVLFYGINFCILTLPRFLKTIKLVDSVIVSQHYHLGFSACVMVLSFLNIKDKRLSMVSFASSLIINLFVADYRLVFSAMTELVGTMIVWKLITTDLIETFILSVRQLLIEDALSMITDIEALKQSIATLSSAVSVRMITNSVRECINYLTSQDSSFSASLNEFMINMESVQNWVISIRTSQVLQIFIILTNNCSCLLCLIIYLCSYSHGDLHNEIRLCVGLIFTVSQLTRFINRYKIKTLEEIAFGNTFINMVDKLDRAIDILIVSLTVTRDGVDKVSFVFKYTADKIRTTTARISEGSAVFCKNVSSFCYETGKRTFEVVRNFASSHPYWTVGIGIMSVLAVVGGVSASRRRSSTREQLQTTID